MSANTDPEGYKTVTYWPSGLTTTDSTNNANYIAPGQMPYVTVPSGAQLDPELLRAMQAAEWERQYAKAVLDAERASLRVVPEDDEEPAPLPEPPKNASAYRGWFR